MEFKNNNSEKKEKLLITSVFNTKETQRKIEENLNNLHEEKTKTNTLNSTLLTKLDYLPSLTNKNYNFTNFKTNYSNNKKIKKPIRLNKMIEFINPINRASLEINSLRTIKENLVKKRYDELHNFKLKIKPVKFYDNYGLNNFVKITNNYSKRFHTFDNQFNNISNYNNIFQPEKRKNIYINKIKLYKNIKTLNNKKRENFLRNIPCRIKNENNSMHIIRSFNEDNGLVNTNYLLRGKNINDIIHNQTNQNFFKNFIKNSKYLGKIKNIE